MYNSSSFLLHQNNLKNIRIIMRSIQIFIIFVVMIAIFGQANSCRISRATTAPWQGTSTLSVGGKIVRQNSDHRIPDRLKVLFSNFIYEQPFNYLHDCDGTDENIYPDKTFKIEWPTVPVAFDNVTPTPLKVNDIFP